MTPDTHYCHCVRRSLLAAAMLAAVFSANAHGANLAYCAAPDSGISDSTPTTSPNESLDDNIVLSADSAESDPDSPQNIRLNGTIEIKNREHAISAENATFNTDTGIADLAGETLYKSDGIIIRSSNATVNITEGTFDLGDAGYEVNNGELVSQGNAGNLIRKADGKLKLNNASYSTCPPGDTSWRLSASEITLDVDAGVGTARNVTLRFQEVPILYTPIFSFPVGNRRKTGLLPPRFDQTDQTGFEYRQPFYWNIRPNWDATFVARTMSERGLQIQSELRHLNDVGTWTLNHESISNDRRQTSNSNRRFSRFRHDGAWTDRWTTQVDVSSVSDTDYFEDLGDSLNIASITHLQRRADLTYSADNYHFRTRLQTYQTVDLDIAPDQRPYRQLPHLTFNYHHPATPKGFEATLDSALVYFDRDDSVTGTRLDIQPRIEWSVNRPGWFTSLASSFRTTRYDLDNVPARDQAQVRNIPVLSADAGLFFQRFNKQNQSTLTLEPRAFYLYAKNRDQSRLPIFDTGTLDFNFSQLFRENSFSGADRVNDANQLSLALSSRMVNSDGREKFSASVGQIFYFADRLVTLPDEQPLTTNTSDIIAELQTEISRRWSGSLNFQWDPNEARTIRSSAQIRYYNGPGKLANFGHRFLEDEGEFAHMSFTWPIHDQWRLASSWDYSLDDDQSIETVLGIEYDSCCWAFRTAARRYITDDGENSTNSFLFELVLKGLGPIGQNVTEILNEAVSGYDFNN